MKKETILIGKTALRHTVEVCAGCNTYPERPHFIYNYRSWLRKKSIMLRMDCAKLLDSMGNLELKYRRDLQQFLTPEHWQKIISAWNQNHAFQFDEKTHVPYYINLLEMQDYTSCSVFSKEINLPDGVSIRIYGNDSDRRPHFHFVRSDGTEAAISLIAPEYLGKAVVPLSPQECASLTAFVYEKGKTDNTVFHAMLSCWDLENGTDYSSKIAQSNMQPIDYLHLC